MIQIVSQIVDGGVSWQSIQTNIGGAGHGAQSTFVGVVRDSNHGKVVTGIDYDCYEPLAKVSFDEIAQEARKQWGLDLRICIIHAKGYLKVGDISLGIGVSSRHRDEAFKACRYIIEEIKVRSPIWKKEYYIDGESEWVKGHALCEAHHGSDSNGRTIHTDGPQ